MIVYLVIALVGSALAALYTESRRRALSAPRWGTDRWRAELPHPPAYLGRHRRGQR